jgi:hypothetical protein
MLSGRHAWNVMLFTTRSHPSEGTIYPGCIPSPPVGCRSLEFDQVLSGCQFILSV